MDLWSGGEEQIPRFARNDNVKQVVASLRMTKIILIEDFSYD